MAREWIVVADASKALILAAEKAGAVPHVVEEIAWDSGRKKAGELVADRPGKSATQSGSAPHAYEAHTDPTVVEEEKLARHLVEVLEKGHEAKKFATFSLYLAPKLLGRVREKLSPTMKKLVVAEEAKDLVHLAIPELQARLKKDIAAR